MSGQATEFGVQLHGTFPMQSYADLARRVERHAFRELTVHDVVWWRPVWPILTLIAANTERVLVGPDVTHPYLRHPVDTAANLGGLDELSGGRAILGLGAGSMLDRVGIASERPLVAVRECAELVQHFLGGGGAYDGTMFTATDQARFFWKPPRHRIPMFVGAFGPRMVESAAGWADELRPPGIWATGFFEDLQRRATAAAAEAGNTGFRVGCDVWLSVDRDRARARALGRRILAQFLPLPQLQPMREYAEIDQNEIDAVGLCLQKGDIDAAADAISDRTLDTFVAAGTPEELRPGLERLVAAGPSTITFSGRLGPDPVASLELLGAELLPHVTA